MIFDRSLKECKEFSKHRFKKGPETENTKNRKENTETYNFD